MGRNKKFYGVPRNGLIFEALLNGNALDTSGNNNNGTATNVVYTRTEKGYQAQAGSFNGSSSKIDLPNLGLGGSSIKSINFNIKMNTFGTDDNIVYTSGVNANNDAFRIYVGSNGRIWMDNYSSGVYGNNLLSLNVNYNITCIYTGGATSASTMLIYVDCVLQPTTFFGTSATPVTTNSNYAIGYYRAAPSKYFNGQLQSIRLYNRVLSQQEITQLYLEGQRMLAGGSNNILSSAVAYYDFDDSGTPGIANDIIGGNNGTVTGATLTQDRFGVANRAYSFNGSSRINVATNLYGKGSLHTTFARFKINTLPTNGQFQFIYCNVVDWGTSGSAYIYNNSGTLQIVSTNYYTSGNINLYVNYAFQTGVYYDIVCTTDNTGMKIYIDGVLIGSNGNAGIFRTTANSFAIGCQPQGPSSFFNGVIDFVAISNTKALSASEVLQLYNESKTNYLYPFRKTLPAFLNEGKVLHLAGDVNGTTAYNIGNNGINGILYSITGGRILQQKYFKTTGNGYIDVGDFYSGSGSYTIGGWFNSDVTAVSGDYNLIYRYSNSSGFDTTRVYYGGYGNNLIRWRWCTGSTTDTNNQLDITESFVAGKWYHMIFELDDVNKTAKFYLNGRLHTSGTFTGNLSKSTNATQKCSFLNRYYNPNEGWDGKATNIFAYNGLLTDNQKQALYYSTFPGV